ncbi:MAG: fumarylacetoacetase [Rhodovarius sp.]|nr:fumarylacetoacetase [Rhodovarius sp.]
MDATHAPGLRSWVESANVPGHDFPIQNLPLGVFSTPGSRPRGGVAIGDMVLDIAAALAAGRLSGAAAEAAAEPTLNRLMSYGQDAAAELRARLSALLAEGAEPLPDLLHPQSAVTMHLPVEVRNFSDFMASRPHCERLGRARNRDNPLPPAFHHLPVAYHSRASSVRPSGTPLRRPWGQFQRDGAVVFAPTEALDFELELAIWIAEENALGEPTPISAADRRIFGIGLLNDWSARDIQRFEMPPLGPFLSKSVMTSVSPWVVTMQAMAPFMAPLPPRAAGDPPCPAHLHSSRPDAMRITMRAAIQTPRMAAAGIAPHVVTEAPFEEMYWSAAQMVAHHTSNGCNLLPGDLLGSGTVSGSRPGQEACLAELLLRGPIILPSGETRRFLEDGDCVIFTARAEAPGAVPIGFGECRGSVLPAAAWPVSEEG